MRILSKSIVLALGLSLLAGTALAQPLSGGASGGGAIQGGSGAPGSGTGIPGAIVNNTTAEGIGEDDTLSPSRAFGMDSRRYVGLGTLLSAEPAHAAAWSRQATSRLVRAQARHIALPYDH